MEPCKQEMTIGGLGATLHAVTDTLKELKGGQERFITILESIATQGTQIERNVDDIDILYDRVRTMELSHERHKVQIGVAATGVSAFVAAITAYITKKMGL